MQRGSTRTFKKSALALVTALGLSTLSAQPALAKTVIDCPNRNAPFSVDAPLIDVMLNPVARATANTALGGMLDKLPPLLASTTTPTFGAILTIKELRYFTADLKVDLPKLDTALRALPVTAADKAARCVRYDNDVPKLSRLGGKPRLLMFEKINGFKDVPSVNAAHAALVSMAERKGWSLVSTEMGGAFNPATLKKFDAVIWNNISGDVLTVSQRRAFKNYVEGGGGFIAFHGSAGDPTYFWEWYADKLIGARFIGHPMAPQFQEARVAVNKAHPLAQSLPAEWRMTEEWYSFGTNPRTVGADVILTLDESTYKPDGPSGRDLRMGDHPLAWTNCIGKGRMFYSAIGHRPESYSQPQAMSLLEDAIGWAADGRKTCKSMAAK